MKTCSCGKMTDDQSTLCPRCAALHVLEIEKDATEERIRAAYLLLVKVWHPDRFQGDAKLAAVAEGKLAAINAAYLFLTSHPAEEDPYSRSNSSATSRANEERSGETVNEPPAREDIVFTKPRRRPFWNSAFGAGILLRCLILACIVAIGGTLLVAADSYLSTNLTTASFYATYKAEKISQFEELKRNILGRLPRNTGQSHAPLETSAPSAPKTPAHGGIEHGAQQNQPRSETILPYITAGLTKSEVLAVQGNPTSSSDDRLKYHGSEIYFKDGRVIGWNIAASAPLRVKLWPDVAVDQGLTRFRVGSSKNEVLVVQGTPNVFSENTFGYGSSEVYFKNNRVVSWKKDAASVPLRTQAQ
jgi:curved DNA-binding protein CbpA